LDSRGDVAPSRKMDRLPRCEKRPRRNGYSREKEIKTGPHHALAHPDGGGVNTRRNRNYERKLKRRDKRKGLEKKDGVCENNPLRYYQRLSLAPPVAATGAPRMLAGGRQEA